MAKYTSYHAQYLAHRITLAGDDVDGFAKSLASAKVDLNPHQVDAAIFALAPPIPRGAILADEVGLGKTIEASLVMAQRWAERRRRILLIVPASLRKQWSQELAEKFGLASKIIEAKSYREAVKAGSRLPFEMGKHVVITSYEFAAQKADDLRRCDWDLVVFDEAHRLRNVYKAGASVRAKALKEALKDRFKLLLTATPLQNSLMELYGLVSVIDDHVFGSEEAFKLLYADRRDAAGLGRLRDRLRSVCRRTLRKDVQEAGHINYTKRYTVTAKFEPHDAELTLYDDLSKFLQRRDTMAFGDKPNQLVTLVVRKILGSSTFAVADTLERILQRLRRHERTIAEDVDDIDTIDEILEENGELDATADTQIDPVKLKAEITELEGFLARARAISVNAKGEKLLAVLQDSLTEVVAKGGKRKAVVFTESVRTQRYLADLLAVNGYDREIVLLNGSNNDAMSQQLYQEWLMKHRGSDAISGSRTADMKAAIVDAFRNDKTILIATESGAEGINLQFCSLLVNFDLPWNPQRVEQRIGRCHRYGQKQDVLVVNFLNLKNRAEERVFELLDLKFNLFKGVFGASDEVLGTITSGTDFERRIFEIYQSARNDAEIDAQFDQLRAELEESIKVDVLNAREKILASFDRDVVQILRSRMGEINEIMGAFEERLIALACAELQDAEFGRYKGKPMFVHNGETWTTGWPLADEQNWRFFKLADDNLAQQLVDKAKARQLTTQKLTFDYGKYENGVLADVKNHVGSSGWLKVAKLVIAVGGRKTERLLLSVLADDGRAIADDTLDRLFCVPGRIEPVGEVAPEPELSGIENAIIAKRLEEARARNAEFLIKESEKLDFYADDLAREIDAKIKDLDETIKGIKKEMRGAVDLALEDKVKLQREIKKRESDKDDLVLERHQRRKEIGKQMEELLNEIEESLKLVPSVEPIFTVRFAING